jgi:hypothetical protein
MNFTPSTTFPTTWRHFRGWHVVLAAGIALAVTVAIGFASLQDSQSGGEAPAPVSRWQKADDADRSLDFIYIVGSEQQRDELLLGATELAHLPLGAGQQPGGVSAIVAPLGDPGAELIVATLLGEANSGLLTGAQIVDLR